MISTQIKKVFFIFSAVILGAGISNTHAKEVLEKDYVETRYDENGYLIAGTQPANGVRILGDASKIIELHESDETPAATKGKKLKQGKSSSVYLVSQVGEIDPGKINPLAINREPTSGKKGRMDALVMEQDLQAISAGLAK